MKISRHYNGVRDASAVKSRAGCACHAVTKNLSPRVQMVIDSRGFPSLGLRSYGGSDGSEIIPQRMVFCSADAVRGDVTRPAAHEIFSHQSAVNSTGADQ
jgi:hypothetical protein